MEFDLRSPRLLEACLRKGILPAELKALPQKAFEAPNRSVDHSAEIIFVSL